MIVLTVPPILIPCMRAMQARDQAKRGKHYSYDFPSGF